MKLLSSLFFISFFVLNSNLHALANENNTKLILSKDDSNEIFISNMDGTDINNISNINLQNAYDYKFFSDGSKIVYFIDQIYLINYDGKNLKKLTNFKDNYSISNISLSPNNKEIAFMKKDKNSMYQVYKIDINGINLTQLTYLKNTFLSISGQSISWSSDSKKIVFSYPERIENDLFKSPMYIMNSDGSNLKKILDQPYYIYFPILSPNNKEVAFCSANDPMLYDYKIFKMNLENKKITKITNETTGKDYTPKWSTDGKKIFFSSDNGSYHVYSINSDGSNLKKISDNLMLDDIVNSNQVEKIFNSLNKKISLISKKPNSTLTVEYVIGEMDIDVLYVFLILLENYNPNQDQLKIIKSIKSLSLGKYFSKRELELIESLSNQFEGNKLQEKQDKLKLYFKNGDLKEKNIEPTSTFIKRYHSFIKIMSKLK